MLYWTSIYSTSLVAVLILILIWLLFFFISFIKEIYLTKLISLVILFGKQRIIFKHPKNIIQIEFNLLLLISRNITNDLLVLISFLIPNFLLMDLSPIISWSKLPIQRWLILCSFVDHPINLVLLILFIFFLLILLIFLILSQ